METYTVMFEWPTKEFNEDGTRIWDDVPAASFSTEWEAITHLCKCTVDHNPKRWHHVEKIESEYVVLNVETGVLGYVLRSE